jgi:hypothetical protein
MIQVGDLVKYTKYLGDLTEFGMVIEKNKTKKTSEQPTEYICVMMFSRTYTNVSLSVEDEGKTWFKIE